MTITITYPISLPLPPYPTKSKVTQDNAVALTESPFTFEQQIFQHQGARWKLSLTFPPMKRALAQTLIAAIGQLNGRAGTFLYGDLDAPAPLGVGTGTPLVNGGTQTGNNLITDGWTHGVTGILKAGDYFDLGSGNTRRMHMVLADANSDGSGNATFLIWPPLRYSPADNSALNLVKPMTQFRLDTAFEWSADEVSTYGISITASESL